MTKAYRVHGMSCEGCARSVTNAIREQLPRVEVAVDLETGIVRVSGADDDARIASAVNDAGFEFRGAIG